MLNHLTDVTELLGDKNYYGSNAVLGNLSVIIDGVTGWSNYNRSLDLDSGLHTTFYTTNNSNTYTVVVYCSYPHQVCVYNLTSSTPLPKVTIKLENFLLGASLVNSTCGNDFVRLAGVTQIGPPTGMKLEAVARLATRIGTAHCSNDTAGALVIPAGSDVHTISLVLGAGTNYDQTKGTAASNFSFRGADPGPYVEAVTSSAATKAERDIRLAHIKDYQSLANAFSLELPDLAGSAGLETSIIFSRYNYAAADDPYLESLLFAYARHLFISSSRANSLPPN